jgi:hypothetical protein
MCTLLVNWQICIQPLLTYTAKKSVLSMPVSNWCDLCSTGSLAVTRVMWQELSLLQIQKDSEMMCDVKTIRTASVV